MRTLILVIGSVFFILSCKKAIKSPEAKTLFRQVPANVSGIDFANNLHYDRNFNIYRYRNFYNKLKSKKENKNLHWSPHYVPI